VPVTNQECAAVVDHVAAELRLKSAVCEKVLKMARGERHKVRARTLTASQVALISSVQSYLDARNLIPVGDLVKYFVAVLETVPAVMDWIKSRARVWLWDEYQDTADEEAALLDLVKPNKSMVVGDPRQAIFGFRGASDKHLWQRDVDSHTVRFNFRSASSIVDVANRVGTVGEEGLVAFRSEPGEIIPVPAEYDETISLTALFAAESPKPVHVLCRTNHQVAMVRDALEYRGVKAIAASPKFDRYAKPPWTGLFLACRHVIDPACEWLRSSMGGLGVEGTALWDVDPQQVRAGDLLSRYAPDEADLLVSEPMLHLSILDFVAWYQRRDLDDLLPGDGQEFDAVVMTSHSAKGSQFKNVVLCDVGRKLGGDDDQEERNLLYVSITRAMDRLVLVGDPDVVARLGGAE